VKIKGQRFQNHSRNVKCSEKLFLTPSEHVSKFSLWTQFLFLSSSFFFFFFWQYWDLNPGAIPWATPPFLFCDGFFEDRFSWTIYLWLALNHDPPDLCFLSSQDYRCEPLLPSSILLIHILYLKISFWKL
jgi:hypothetical protein